MRPPAMAASRAAEEVHVTPGAISHQVRALEEDLGLQLFHRHGKRISITETGERFAATIRKALGEIAQAADHLRSLTRQQRLVISATPSFASRWLAPRLWKFIDAHPEIEVVLQSGSHLADLRLDGVDTASASGAASTRAWSPRSSATITTTRWPRPAIAASRTRSSRARPTWCIARCCAWTRANPGSRG
jgi:DNA-binding transcriptional LysR family regulator